ncbi:TPA: WapI family immunity protein [Klebsiella aerogenes]|uniref:Uncharacterized protein n=3 Tax=Klebsiella aerogenes TaxID=548 RepID=A0AAW9E032_KLEAE|nr:hypothetical protein [Klebsiella aerogenes]AMQ59361.1 hypothetical protein AL497_06240 [Klebsiella aerogenes]AVE98545.1 hypothetical protein AM441_07865 [Klebsiella aerogenes]AYY00171.1 hypothetical protein EGY11_08630 [Klebsiella aerogenes]EIV3813534.1 hypothetical protein [Klebsiella aerogenes]EIV5805413.1 hypothetical protein [Klebsiella aerogenes]
MIEIISDKKILRITAFERENTPNAPAYDWIKTYVEYHLPELNVQYQASFNVGELSELKDNLIALHTHLINEDAHTDVIFESTENQLNLVFTPSSFGHGALMSLTLRPENPAESVVISDCLGLDESYFPALIAGLEEIINLQR